MCPSLFNESSSPSHIITPSHALLPTDLVICLDERGVANFAGSNESSAELYVAISNDDYTSNSSMSTCVASKVPAVHQSASVKSKPHTWRARSPQYDLCLSLDHNAPQTSTALSLPVRSLYLPGRRLAGYLRGE
jgi:hypothetical protein